MKTCGKAAGSGVFNFRFCEDRSGRGIRLGDAVWVDYPRLGEFALKRVTPEHIDLLVVAGCVHFVDRASRRDKIAQWGRKLSLSIPVHRYEMWSTGKVIQALRDCLYFVTGDNWEFEFRKRTTDYPSLSENFLSIGEQSHEKPSIVAYSGGLDSYAGVELLSKFGRERMPYMIKTQSYGSGPSSRAHSGRKDPTHVPLLVQACLGSLEKEKESTARTRTFLFFSIAAVAAALVGTSSIISCENGQGSVGPSLVSDSSEFPFRTTHPGFFRRLESLFDLAMGGKFEISHPFLWDTKGQILARLGRQRLIAALPKTKSCARYPMRHKGRRPALACGICGGCLLRRTSIVGSGNPDLGANEAYYWQNLSAPTIDGSSVGTTSPLDRRIAIRNVLDMDRLGRVLDEADPAFQRNCYELAEACSTSLEETSSKLTALLRRHREEWHAFLDTLDLRSWVRALVSGAQQ